MNRIVSILLMILVARGSFGQMAKVGYTAMTLADLEARDPVPYERVEVIHGATNCLWDEPRLFIHDPFSSATPIRGYVTTNHAMSGRYVSSDRWSSDHNLKNFLAVGDGVVDDTPAFEAAPLVVTSGKKLEIPWGVYNVTRELPIPQDYVTYYGHGYGSDIRVAHNGHAFAHYGVLSGQPRRYGVQFKDIRFTVAAGFFPSNALHLGDVSYSLFERVFVTGGAAPGFASAVYTWGNYSIPDSIFGGNWGDKFVDCEFYNRPGTNWVFYGSGGPGPTGGPNDLKLIDNYFGGGLGGARNDGAVGAIFLENCNSVRVSGNDIEQWSTNAIYIGTNATEITIEKNRFEHQGGFLDVRSTLQVGSNSVVTFRDNMTRDQGGVLQKFRTDSFPGTIMDTSVPINQWYSQNVIFGIEPSFNSANYEPLAAFTKLSLMTRHATYTNALVIGNFDGIENPRLILMNEGTNRTVISSGSSINSIPLYIMGSDTYAKFGISESSILGEGVGSAGRPGGGSGAFTVHGGIFGGREPRDSYVEGYTAMTHGAYMRTYYADDVIGYFAQIVDGITNRRVELSVRYDRVQLRDGYTTGGGLIEVVSGNRTNLVIRDHLVEIRTNAEFARAITLNVSTEPNTPTNAASIWLDSPFPLGLAAKELAIKWPDASVSKFWHNGNHGSGSGLDADLFEGQHGPFYLARSNHVGTIPWSDVSGTPTTLSGYGITDPVWTSTNDGTGSGLDADLLDGQHGAYYLARGNHTGTQSWSTITGTPTTISGYGITDANFLPLAGGTVTGGLYLTGLPSDVSSVASYRFMVRDPGDNQIKPMTAAYALGFLDAAPSSHNHAASAITSGTMIGDRLGTGTPSTNTFLQGNGTGNSPVWATIPSTPSPTNGIADAPADGVLYGRLNNSWTGVDIGLISGMSAFGSSWIQDVASASDGRNTLELTGGSAVSIDSPARHGVRVNSGGSTSTRHRLNLIAGAGISLSLTDDAGDDESDATIRLADGDYGDISIGSSGTTMTVDNDTITYAKIQPPASTNMVLGFGAGTPGDVKELAVGTGLKTTTTGIQANIVPGTNVVITTNGTALQINVPTPAYGDTAAFAVAAFTAVSDDGDGVPVPQTLDGANSSGVVSVTRVTNTGVYLVELSASQSASPYKRVEICTIATAEEVFRASVINIEPDQVSTGTSIYIFNQNGNLAEGQQAMFRIYAH